MRDTDYAYAVARVRSFENQLLTKQDIEQLLSFESVNDCLRFLSDKGWGDQKNESFSDMLQCESDKTWSLIREVAPDKNVFNLFLYKNDFHNLKATIKSVVSNSANDSKIFLSEGTVSIENLKNAVTNRDFSDLPTFLKEVGEKALDIILHTGNGQLVDIMLDKACLDAIWECGKQSNNDFFKKYAEITVALADIKIAVRCIKTGKDREFLKASLAKCDSLDIARIIDSAQNLDSLMDYLRNTDYAYCVDLLIKDSSQFEKWCDDLIMKEILLAKRSSFGPEPLVGYLLGRETEIKVVRIILIAKANDMSTDFVRERLRDLYV